MSSIDLAPGEGSYEEPAQDERRARHRGEQLKQEKERLRRELKRDFGSNWVSVPYQWATWYSTYYLLFGEGSSREFADMWWQFQYLKLGGQEDKVQAGLRYPVLARYEPTIRRYWFKSGKMKISKIDEVLSALGIQAGTLLLDPRGWMAAPPRNKVEAMVRNMVLPAGLDDDTLLAVLLAGQPNRSNRQRDRERRERAVLSQFARYRDIEAWEAIKRAVPKMLEEDPMARAIIEAGRIDYAELMSGP